MRRSTLTPSRRSARRSSGASSNDAKCRDLYDLWNIFEVHTGVDPFSVWHRFQQKASHKGIDPNVFFEKWNTSEAWYQSRWAAELADYLGDDLPNYTTTHRSVDRKVVEIKRYLDQ